MGKDPVVLDKKPTAVKITLEEKDGDKGTKPRELTFLLGKQTDKDRLYVKVAGEKRVTVAILVKRERRFLGFFQALLRRVLAARR